MRIPIVFSFDKYFSLAADIALKSLVDSKAFDTDYEIFCIDDGGLPCGVHRYFEDRYKVQWLSVDEKVFSDVPLCKGWNRNTYYRLIVPDLLSRYDKIIWSDVDVLFKKDLSSVFAIDLGGFDWAGVAAEVNDSNISCHVYRPENGNPFIYWPGFMVYNAVKWRREGLTRKCFEVIRRYNTALTFCDLDVLNLVTRAIARLPFEYCVLETIADWPSIESAPEYPFLSRVYSLDELEHAAKNPAIIHYAGINPKVWNRRREDIPDHYWEYIKGSPFFRRDFYFPSAATDMKSALLFAAYKTCPVRSAREALKRKWRGVKWSNQYQHSQLRRLEGGNGSR